MISYLERAQELIKSLYPFIEGLEDPDDYRWAVSTYNAMKHAEVIFRNGISRVVFINDDYAIKCDYGTVTSCGNCESEMKMYHTAVEEGFAHLLVKIDCFEYQHMKFYIMPRAYDIGRYKDWDTYWSDTEIDWINQHIDDLHAENYGMLGDNLVVIDYACPPF